MKLLHYFTICACFFLLLAGPVGIYNSWTQYQRISKTKNWLEVEGQIVKSDIKVIEDAGTAYLPDIQYTYSIDGKSYDNSQIILDKPVQFGKTSLAEEYCLKYPLDSKHNIYYNPQNHSESILENGVHTRHLFDFILPLIAFVLGIGLFYILFFKDREAGKKEPAPSNEIE